MADVPPTSLGRSAGSFVRRLLRPAVRGVVRFVVLRPRVHRLVGIAARVPFARPALLRAFGPPPAGAASADAVPAPADPNAALLYRPGPPPGDAGGLVTLDALYHLSRTLPDRR